jgi:hypothetical protein
MISRRDRESLSTYSVEAGVLFLALDWPLLLLIFIQTLANS